MGVEKPIVGSVFDEDTLFRNIEELYKYSMQREYETMRNPEKKLQWMRVIYDLNSGVWHRITDPSVVTFEVCYRSTTQGRVTLFVSFPLHTYPRADLVPISRTEIDYWE